MSFRDTPTIGAAAATLAATLLLAACGPPEGTSDHESTRQSLETNVQSLSQRTSGAAKFIEQNGVATNTYAMYSSAMEGEASSDCADANNCGGSADEEPASNDHSVVVDTTESSKWVVEALLRTVFTQKNVENKTGNSITYRLRGENVCGQRNSPGYRDCVQQVDDFALRIRVTNPSADTLNFEIMVGPQRHKPVDVELSETRLSVLARLGGIKSAVEHYDSITDEPMAQDLPGTMQGHLRATLESDRPRHAHSELKIEKDIDVSGNDYGIQLARAADPVFQMTADGQAETVSSEVNFNEIEVAYPITYGSYDESTDEQTLEYLVHLAGMTGRSTLSNGTESLEIENVGFGDSTSWVKIDGQQVFSGDLNPNDGRTVDITVSPNDIEDDNGLAVEVQPALEVLTEWDLDHVKDVLEVPEWAVNYQFEGRLGGANPAELLTTDDFLKVAQGQLDLGSVDPEASVMVDQGQCLLSADKQQDGSGSGDTDSDHPLSYLEAGSCPSE
jgi:hypothetical protein